MKLKNKKGFTLIELLAVIVVLAIIALIATPIVMNTIKNAKKGAAERSADNYVKAVEQKVAESRIDGTKIANRTYNIQPDGNLCPASGCGENDKDKITIDMSGTKPTSGTVTISNGGVSQNETTMTVGDYNVKYNQEKNNYEATEKGKTSLICDLQEGTSQTIGSKYTCHLDSDRIFYVLEISGDNVSLILDRNFTDDTVSKVAWCIDGGDNNTTCQNINSKEEGTPLKHIQDTFGTKVNVNLPSASQIAIASGKTFDGSSISRLSMTWLYTGAGYWTASSHAANYNEAWFVCDDDHGSIYNAPVTLSSVNGVRPVITVSKSNLS
jgi:type IV pilus assembly protein PilA